MRGLLVLSGLSFWCLAACVATPTTPTTRARDGAAEAGTGGRGSLLESAPGPLKPAEGPPLTVRAGDGASPVVRSLDAPARRPEQYGALVISELMIDPVNVADTAGEWFELHNPGVEPFELQGCLLEDGSAEAHVIADSTRVVAHGFATFARDRAGAIAPVGLASFSLKNDADLLELRCDGVTIDRVSYDRALGFPVVAGAAMSLDSEKLDADQNDAAGAWCVAMGEGGGDRGSPGRANPRCSAE